MKKPKGRYGLYISLGILGLAIAGSAFLYKREADKAKQLEAQATDLREQISGIILSVTPTDEHQHHLEDQLTQVEGKYQEIVSQALEWNYLPQPMSGLEFHGYMGNTIDTIREAARQQGILVDDDARYLGFEEYSVAPPGLDEDVLQLQREFSAAVDIARLLVASNVYSIDRMVRGREARMDASTPSTVRDRLLQEEDLSPSRRRSQQDFYDVVPFRVQFTCTYPSLAFFMKSLISPQRLGGDRLPKNFLVINDMRFKVQEEEDEESEKLRRRSPETVTPAIAYTPTGRRTRLRPEDIPEDLPGAEAMIDRLGEDRALRFFQLWRTWPQERREIFRLERRLGETISEDERERATARLKRMQEEFKQRRELEGRPPEYSTLEVTMLIDFVQFTEKLISELGEKGSDTPATPRSPSMARR